MYYEEKIINGIMHYRTDPNGEWRAYEIQELSRRYEEMKRWYNKKIIALKRQSVLQAKA